MRTLEHKLKTPAFWFTLASINHRIVLLVLAFGCAISGFSCAGDTMNHLLSIYTFTIFTPQVAIEMIALLALILVSGRNPDGPSSLIPAMIFITTLGLTIAFSYWLF